MIYFETERLIARDYLERDYLPFSQMNADEEVMKYFPARLTQVESNALLDRNQKELTSLGYGLSQLKLNLLMNSSDLLDCMKRHSKQNSPLASKLVGG